MNKVLLKDVAIEYKQTIKEKSEDISIVGLEHLEPENILLENWDVGKENTFTKGFKKGHVLFGRRRAYLKKAALAQCEGVCSGDITVIEAKEDKIDPKLLPFIIQNERLFDYAVKNSAGSLSPRVKWEHLQNYEFMLPEMTKQKEISDILWSMENTKRSYEKMKNSLDDLIKSQFIEMCKNKKEYTTISEYVDENIGLVKDVFSKDDIIKYIEISSINNQNNKIEEPTIIALRDAPTSAKYHIKKGDILVSLVRPNLKKIAVNEFDEENVVGTSGFCVLRISGNSSIEYLKYIVLSDDFTEKMTRSATGATYPTIKKEDVLGYAIPVLSKNEILTFTNSAKLIDKSKFEIEQALENLKKAQKSLLNEVFSSKTSLN